MPTPVHRTVKSSLGMLVSFIIVVLVASFLGERDSCLRQADVRAQSQIRGAVQIKFLLLAADARDRAAVQEPPRLANIDRDVAAKYRQLATEVKPLKLLSCGLPWPETPPAPPHVKEFRPYTPGTKS